jgi:peptidoglycan hydrolase CwlO-like protein
MKDFSGKTEFMAVLENQQNTINFLVKQVKEYAEKIETLENQVVFLKESNNYKKEKIEELIIKIEEISHK